MKWENVRAPSARQPVPAPTPTPVEAEEPPRRYLSARAAGMIGAALVVVLILVVWVLRKPAPPELLRPAGSAAAAPPAPSAKEYKSENVIIRFSDQAGDAPADGRR